MKNWTFEGKEITDEFCIPEGAFGFVYLVSNNVNGMLYVGKKQIQSVRKLPPLKGYKRKRTVIKESKWRDYWSSSDDIKEYLTEFGKDNFSREILYFCFSKASLTFHETKEQFNRNVLYSVNESGEFTYYNKNISGAYYRNKNIMNELGLLSIRPGDLYSTSKTPHITGLA